LAGRSAAGGGPADGPHAFVDHFGNAITDITERDLRDASPRPRTPGLEIVVAGRALRGLAPRLGDAAVHSVVDRRLERPARRSPRWAATPPSVWASAKATRSPSPSPED